MCVSNALLTILLFVCIGLLNSLSVWNTLLNIVMTVRLSVEPHMQLSDIPSREDKISPEQMSRDPQSRRQ